MRQFIRSLYRLALSSLTILSCAALIVRLDPVSSTNVHSWFSPLFVDLLPGNTLTDFSNCEVDRVPAFHELVCRTYADVEIEVVYDLHKESISRTAFELGNRAITLGDLVIAWDTPSSVWFDDAQVLVEWHTKAALLQGNNLSPTALIESMIFFDHATSSAELVLHYFDPSVRLRSHISWQGFIALREM